MAKRTKARSAKVVHIAHMNEAATVAIAHVKFAAQQIRTAKLLPNRHKSSCSTAASELIHSAELVGIAKAHAGSGPIATGRARRAHKMLEGTRRAFFAICYR